MTIRKSIRIERPPQAVFHAFCNEIGRWWPIRQGFAFNGQRTTNVAFEDRVGGRFYEQLNDGSEFEVGRVTAWEPPKRVAFTWRAPAWEAATQVDVRFIAEGGGTRVELEHSGWEQGPTISKEAKGYSEGWDFILGQFESHTGAAEVVR
ncbi:MAG TPA: SRPBCC domain-containing protein [Candidatus Binataceae bacterium]|nr:SRPBCC domain-containing protein [Candidatus Binataceae bacterium]